LGLQGQIPGGMGGEDSLEQNFQGVGNRITLLEHLLRLKDFIKIVLVNSGKVLHKGVILGEGARVLVKERKEKRKKRKEKKTWSSGCDVVRWRVFSGDSNE